MQKYPTQKKNIRIKKFLKAMLTVALGFLLGLGMVVGVIGASIQHQERIAETVMEEIYE